MGGVALLILFVLAHGKGPRLRAAGTITAWAKFLGTATLVGMQGAP